MPHIPLKSICAPAGVAAALLLAMAATNTAQAVPNFARQTNLDCMTCHMSWLELTPTGRQFKLNGYTLGARQWLPSAGMPPPAPKQLTSQLRPR